MATVGQSHREQIVVSVFKGKRELTGRQRRDANQASSETAEFRTGRATGEKKTEQTKNEETLHKVSHVG